MEWNLIQALRIFVSRLIRSWPFLRALAAGRKHRSTGVLTVVDSRTDQKYTIPIVDNAIRAIDFKAIQANAEGKGYSGLKVFDPGFFNTACTESQITYMSVQLSMALFRFYYFSRTNDRFEKTEMVKMVLHTIVNILSTNFVKRTISTK